jgi:predicted alpha/beta superfamily hydrolase
LGFTDIGSRIDFYPSFNSKFVEARHIEVFVPGQLVEETPCSVLYMHDGQNVFNPNTSFAGVAWEADKALKQLLKSDRIEPSIIVAIWNSKERLKEYLPVINTDNLKFSEPSERYLRFITEELKPFIDYRYNTLTGPENTSIMGSSMGGLISIFALSRYPDVFGSVACLSTHWPALGQQFPEILKDLIPASGKYRIYYDFGTCTLDAPYELYQRVVDEFMRTKGFIEGKDWVTLKFDGADHSEKAWKDRLHVPLKFLLGWEK